VLKPDERIPSVGKLAKTLVVNPTTVKTTYLELENMGYLYTDHGKEWYVTTPRAKLENPESQNTIHGLYGRIQSDIRELINQGEQLEDVEHLLGLGEKIYLKVEGLTKYYDKVKALDKFDLGIKKGSIYGLVGVNGSGKTTVVKHLANILQADEGQIAIDNMSIYEAVNKLNISYMPEETHFLPSYNLKKLSGYIKTKHKKTWDEERYQRLVEAFGLNQNQELDTFSRGMQKQGAFIIAICTSPDILLLDETIDGLDPIIRHEVYREIINDVVDRQMTVLVTSHNTSELDGFCDYIGIIERGHLVIQRNLDEMKINIHKIHAAFSSDSLTNQYPYDGLDVLYMEEFGNTDVLVVRGKKDEISEHLLSFNPLLYDHMPITLEEIFIYERLGDENE
jgi:ABC-2 type transport system ATP-binding protein